MKKIIKVTILIMCVLLVVIGSYNLGYNDIKSNLLQCSKAEIQKGTMWSLISPNYMVNIYWDGRITFGYYDDSGNWESNNYIAEENFTKYYSIVMRDLIE